MRITRAPRLRAASCPRSAPATPRLRSTCGSPGSPTPDWSPQPPSRRRRPRSPRAPLRPRGRASRVPALNGSSSNAPIGPFQKMVPAVRTSSGCRHRAVRGPDIESHPARRGRRCRRVAVVRRRHRGGRPARGRTAAPSEARASWRAPRSARGPGVTSSSAHSEAPTAWPGGGQEREAHRAADQQRVGDAPGSDSITAELVGHLGAAEHRHQRPGGLVEQPAAASSPRARAAARRRARASGAPPPRCEA